MARSLFFDIEAGGLQGSRSSIQSISWGGPGIGIGSAYAEPQAGTWVGKWAEQNVWEPIKRMRPGFQSEKQVLSQFLGVVEGLPEGSTLMGWNTGYQVAPQGPGVRGFDIPMLMTRAQKYGMGKQFESAFGRLQIRDVGQEYAYRLSREVTGWGRKANLVERGLLDPDLFRQAEGYVKAAINVRQGLPGASEATVAKELGRGGFKVSGWKQDLIYEAMMGKPYQAHMSSADVAAGLELADMFPKRRIFQSEADVVRWGRSALKNKLISSAISPPRLGAEAAGRFDDILAQATAQELRGGPAYAGFAKEFAQGLESRVLTAGGNLESVAAGMGMGLEGGRVWSESKVASTLSASKAYGLAEAADIVMPFLYRHRWKIGIGAGAAALWMAEPLSWFSGKDDAYNTIEGLSERGLASRKRKQMTAFGSGWDALRNLIRAGETFEQMLGTSTFKQALSEASVVGKLGKGTQAEVFRMKGTFRGQEFEFARKIGDIGKNEVTAMRELQHRMAPTVYGASKGQIDMELIQGKALSDITDPDLLETLFRKASTMRTGRWAHGDPSLSNIMLVNRGGTKYNLALIDWGRAKPINKFDGFQHGGMASRSRPAYGFGSGWRGLIKIAPEISEAFQSVMQRGLGSRVAGQTFDISEKTSGLFRAVAKELQKGKVTPEQRTALMGFMKEAQAAEKAGYKQFAVIDPKMIAEKARIEGVSYGKALRSTIAHERGHQSITQFGLRKKVAGLPVPGRELRQWKKTELGQKYFQRDPDTAKEEFLMAVMEGKMGGASTRYLSTEKMLGQLPTIKRGPGGQLINGSAFSGRDDAANLIEGFNETGIMGRLRKTFGFGSGWRGILKLPSSMNYIKTGGKEVLRRGTTLPVEEALKSAETWLGKRAKVLRGQLEKSEFGKLPENFMSKQKAWDEVHKFYQGLQEAKQAGFQEVVGLTPAFLEKASYRQIKRTILHERGHIGLGLQTGKPFAGPARMAVPVPEAAGQVLEKLGYKARHQSEELAMRAFSYSAVPRAGKIEAKWAAEMPQFVSRGRQASEVAYKHKIKLMKKWYNAHKMGVVRVSRMSKQGARGHLRKTGAMPH